MYHLWISSCLLYLGVAESVDESNIRSGQEWKFQAREFGDVFYEPVASDFIATVKMVDFSNCQKIPSVDDFYNGLILNFHRFEEWHRPWVQPPLPPQPPYRAHYINNVNRLKDMNGSVVSRYEVKSSRVVLYDFYKNFGWMNMKWPGDIRTNNFTFELEAFCGMPQLYIPLVHWEDSSLRGKKGFMLHIYPDPKLMPGAPDPYYQAGIQWYRKLDFTKSGEVCKSKFIFKIDLFELLNNMKSFYLANLRKGIQGKYYSGEQAKPQGNLNTEPLVGPKIGESAEELCSSVQAESIINFRTFYQIVKTIIQWLPAARSADIAWDDVIGEDDILRI